MSSKLRFGNSKCLHQNQRVRKTTKPSTQSFNKFTRLPAELQLQILDHHGDTLRRHHYFCRQDTLLVMPGMDSSDWIEYFCKDPSGDAYRESHAETGQHIYNNDGLASEKISVCHKLWGDGRAAADNVWANFSADVFYFSHFPTAQEPAPALGPLGVDPRFDEPGHWFWKVQKLALNVNGDDPFCSTPVPPGPLHPVDKHILQRTQALKTIYLVAAPFLFPKQQAREPRTLVDGFVLPKEPLGEDQTGEDNDPTFPMDFLRSVTALKCELEDLFRGRQGRAVEVVIVLKQKDIDNGSFGSLFLQRRQGGGQWMWS